jgi:hypothetical protein
MLARLTRALHKPSYREADLRLWSARLLLLSGVILIDQLLTLMLSRTHQAAEMSRLKSLVIFLVAGVAMAVYHWRTPRQNTAAERQVWLIWLGALLAYGAIGLVRLLLFHFDLLIAGPAAPNYLSEWVSYPFFAIVSGLAFFVMGGSYGGRYYIISMGFFVLALLLPWCLAWAPLAFGLLWALCLVWIASHLSRSRAAPAGRS